VTIDIDRTAWAQDATRPAARFAALVGPDRAELVRDALREQHERYVAHVLECESKAHRASYDRQTRWYERAEMYRGLAWRTRETLEFLGGSIGT